MVDGDTFHMNGQKIRIWGIDAVELHQTCLKSGQSYECGKSARLHLQSVIGKNVPICTAQPKSPKEARTVGSCQVDGKDIGTRWSNLAGHLIISILAKASMRLRNGMPVKTSAAFGQENSKTLMFGVKVTKLTDKIKINFFGIA